MKTALKLAWLALWLVACNAPTPPVIPLTVYPTQPAALPTTPAHAALPTFTPRPTLTPRLTRTATPVVTRAPTTSPQPVQTRTPTPTFDVRQAVSVTPAPAAQCPSVNPNVVFDTQIVSQTAELRRAALLNFLNAGGAPSTAVAVFRQHFKPSPYAWALYRIRFDPLKAFFRQDLTGDGVPELVVLSEIYRCRAGLYELLYEIPLVSDHDMAIDSIQDMNLDGLPEIVTIAYGCIWGQCWDVQVYEWDGQSFRALITPEIAGIINGSVSIADTDSNGTLELILSGNVTNENYGDPPWRFERDLYEWNGKTFAPHRTTFSEPEYRFQAVQDGDVAMAAGEYDLALAFYQQAIFDDQLKPWSEALREQADQLRNWDGRTPTPTPLAADPAEYYNLAAYARYRILLLHVAQGYMPEAQTVYDTLQEKFPAGQPGHPYAELANRFWAEYQATGQLNTACAQAIAYAAEHPQAILFFLGNTEYKLEGTDYLFWYHGSQSLFYRPETVCPFK